MKRDAGRIGIWGCSGSGKTTRQKEMVETRTRVIALDPKGTSFTRGFKRCTSLQAVYREIREGWNTGFKIQVPTGMKKADCLAVIAQIVPALFCIQQPYIDGKRGMAGKEISLVIDEADLFFPNKFTPDDVQEQIDHLTRRGREWGIEVIAASQRLAQVATTFRGNCTEHYFLSQGDHNDIDAVLSMIGRQHKESLLGLKAHEYLHKSMEIGGAVRKGKNTSKFVK